MAGDGHLDRLTEAVRGAAQRALDRALWDEAIELSQQLLDVDPEDRQAAGMLEFAQARGRRADPEQGRRFLTVMFSDLVGSTPLSERLDPEDYLAAIAAYQEVVRSVVIGRVGHIEQFQGDGVVAYFGYPTASEDDQVQAVEAGLEIVQGVEEAGREIGLELTSRVGVHLGRAILTAPSLGARHQSAAIGLAANVAARIQGIARPGTVVVSEVVADHVSPYFDLTPVGSPTLRGVSDDVRVFEVRGPRALSTSADVRLTAEMVDRTAERAAIDAAWHAACTGGEGDRLVVLVGEPGIGKSRLVRYATELVEGLAATLIEINCGSGLRHVGLGATREGITKALGLPVAHHPGPARAALGARAATVGLSPRSRAVLESLLGHQGITGAMPELSPTALREAIITALLEWFAAEAQLAPTALVVEDLHWADATALETIRRLTEGPLPPGLAVVLTSRSEGFPDALASRRSGALEIGTLARSDTLDMIRGLSGGAIDDHAAHELAERSEGVPLFTEHLVMAQTAPRPTATQHAVELPARIEALLQTRLGATGPGRGIAEVAAVIGREFTVDVLEATLARLGPKSPLHADGVRPALRLLEQAGLVEPDGPDRMRFVHSLVRDAAYAMQLRSERPIRHRAVAEAITGLRGPDAAPEALAHHYERAGERQLAAAAHLSAAANAADIAEFGLALTHLRSATDLLGDLPGAAARRLELAACMQIGAAYAASFSYFNTEAVDAYRRALELCDAIAEEEGAEDPGLLLPVIAALGGLWSKEVVTGDMAAASLVTDRLERVLDKAEGLDPEVHRFSLSCRGLELLYQGRTPQAIATLRSAARLGHAGPISLSLGTPHDFVAANDGVLAVALTVIGDDEGAEVALEEALARTRELAFPVGPFSEAVVQLYAAYRHRLRREVDAARVASERVRAIGDQYGFQEHSMLGQMLTLVASAVGGDDGARAALGVTLTAWRMAGGGLAVPVLLAELAEAHLQAGEVDAARGVLDQAAAMVEQTDQRAAEPEILRLRALADAQSGTPGVTVASALVNAAHVALAQGSTRLAARSVMDLRDLGGGRVPVVAREVARRLRSQIPATAGGELRELAEWLSAQR